VDGEVEGSLSQGGTLVLQIDATLPGGWEGLHLVEAAVVVGGREVDRVSYDIEDAQITVGANRIVVGTGAAASGTLLRVSGSDVVVTTGGAHLLVNITADVVRSIPADARFELSVIGDRGTSTSAVVRLAQPADEGLTGETVVALIAAALFVGAFVGNLFASKRRPPVRPSIYATVQRRLEQERAGSGDLGP
jgi:hypothetical protein